MEKLRGIVTEEDLKRVGCVKTESRFSDLDIYKSEDYMYLVKNIGNERYEIVLGYSRSDSKDSWR